MEKVKNKSYILRSMPTLDSKTLPDSTTCTFLAEGSGEAAKGNMNIYISNILLKCMLKIAMNNNHYYLQI